MFGRSLLSIFLAGGLLALPLAGLPFGSGDAEAQGDQANRPQNFQSHRDIEHQVNKAQPVEAPFESAGIGAAATGDSTTNINANANANEVLGYHPYWMGNAWQNYRWSAMSTLAWFKTAVYAWGDIVPDTNYDPPASMISTAHANGVDVVLTVTSVDTSSTNTLLDSPTYYHNAATEIVAEVMSVGADGVNVDFELVDSSNRAKLVDFVDDLTTKMHAAKPGSEVTVATPAIDWDNAYDIAGLAAASDGLMIMAYDYFGSWSSQAGPVAPLYDPHWRTNYSVRSTLDTYLAQAPANKLIMGIPWYGSKWKTTTTGVPGNVTSWEGSILYDSAEAQAQTYGKSWYSDSQATYTKIEGGTKYQTWYDDFSSLIAKQQVALDEGLKGIGIWALGYEGGRTEIWDAVSAYANPLPDTLKRLPYHGAGDRFDMAISVSQDSYPTADSANSVTLATAYNWPDSLAGAPFAKKKGGPLLVTHQDSLTPRIEAEIDRLLPSGGTVYVLGGFSAVGSAVTDRLAAKGYVIGRIAGKNRVDTARKLADHIGGSPSQVFLATKDNFPDALSFASPAAKELAPVLLTDPNNLSPEVSNYLTTGAGKTATLVYIGGGSAAISNNVQNQITAIGKTAYRLEGSDRYHTSEQIAKHFYTSPTDITIANGRSEVDGLAGAPHAASHLAPILLSNDEVLPQQIYNYIQQRAGSIASGYVYGGFGVISRNLETAAQALFSP